VRLDHKNTFYLAKKTITRGKTKPTEWEKIFVSSSYNRGLISIIYNELKKLDTKRTKIQVSKWANELNRQFSKEVQMTNKYMKKSSLSLATREMQIKTILIIHLILVRMAIKKDKDMVEKEHL
jgi:hypothetical protein